MTANVWSTILETTLQKSWQKILPLVVSDDITPSPAENELLPLVRQLPCLLYTSRCV